MVSWSEDTQWLKYTRHYLNLIDDPNLTESSDTSYVIDQ